eukprot:TRINITY_DN3374_c0_g1_i1.p1 TRINITY_DN3374_c0_g1~~TRINITY_DN3374_c0_g1_i1.p1  ORF type:complete len:858 (-),score=173.85 TRINITY_DN3374_c0_g1_i1:271-2844(-)
MAATESLPQEGGATSSSSGEAEPVEVASPSNERQLPGSRTVRSSASSLVGPLIAVACAVAAFKAGYDQGHRAELDAQTQRRLDNVEPTSGKPGLSSGRAADGQQTAYGDCCAKCSGSAYCSPNSGNCYDKKRKDYYKQCGGLAPPPAPATGGCCDACTGSPYCSPRSGRCYGSQRKDYYATCIRLKPGNLVWSDEFEDVYGNGSVDLSKWMHNNGEVFNDELQAYTGRPENSFVKDSVLTITAQCERYDGWQTADYTSARLTTMGRADWGPGHRIEIRAKLPGGVGTWPAIWMLPTDNAYGDWPKSGEIDIMEAVGCDHGEVFGTVHTGAYNHMFRTQRGANAYLDYQDWHTYAIDWEGTQIKWYVDGDHYFTFSPDDRSSSDKWPFGQKFYLILNIAIGGHWGGYCLKRPPSCLTAWEMGVPQKMQVDFVRVYELVPDVQPLPQPQTTQQVEARAAAEGAKGSPAAIAKSVSAVTAGMTEEEVMASGSCCNECLGQPFCSPMSGICYDQKRKDYYHSCSGMAPPPPPDGLAPPPAPAPASCCGGCPKAAFCSPVSKNCYSFKRKHYYETCMKMEIGELVWKDEFEDVYGNRSVDSTKWMHNNGEVFNKELQAYTGRLNNSYVSDGTLKVVAQCEEYKDGWQPAQYTSARLTTQGIASWGPNHRVEIRAKVPDGIGSWPALWMLPDEDKFGPWPKSGEIDIMESVGCDHGEIFGTVHTGAYNHMFRTQQGNHHYLDYTEWHTYAIDWEGHQIKWYADGHHYHTFSPSDRSNSDKWPFDEKFYLIMNIAVGGDWGGYCLGRRSPSCRRHEEFGMAQTMEVDYVRVYELVEKRSGSRRVSAARGASEQSREAGRAEESR